MTNPYVNKEAIERVASNDRTLEGALSVVSLVLILGIAGLLTYLIIASHGLLAMWLLALYIAAPVAYTVVKSI